MLILDVCYYDNFICKTQKVIQCIGSCSQIRNSLEDFCWSSTCTNSTSNYPFSILLGFRSTTNLTSSSGCCSRNKPWENSLFSINNRQRAVQSALDLIVMERDEVEHPSFWLPHTWIRHQNIECSAKISSIFYKFKCGAFKMVREDSK